MLHVRTNESHGDVGRESSLFVIVVGHGCVGGRRRDNQTAKPGVGAPCDPLDEASLGLVDYLSDRMNHPLVDSVLSWKPLMQGFVHSRNVGFEGSHRVAASLRDGESGVFERPNDVNHEKRVVGADIGQRWFRDGTRELGS